MKNVLVLFAFATLALPCFAQCPFTSTLRKNDSLCIGADTLFVNSPGSLSKLTWYNGNTVDTTVTAHSSPIIITVAGGNGVGNAANQLNFPTGVFVDGSGNIYACDNRNQRVLKFPAGSSMATNGITVAGGNGAGSAANQLDGPYAVCVDAGGSLYVVDTYNNRIQKFPPGSSGSTNGITVAGGNGIGGAANQLDDPVSISFDGAGNMYIADASNARIQQFPPGSTSATNGTTVAGGNGPGTAANQLLGPYSVFVDGAGNIYVADFGNGRVQEFPPGSTSATNGVTVAGGNGLGTAATQLLDPSSVWVDGSGNIYVDDDLNSRVLEFPPGSTSATNGTTVAGGHGQGDSPDQINNSYSVFVDGSGNIYVADDANCRIQEYTTVLSIDTIYVPVTPGTYTAVVTNSSGCIDTTNAIVIAAPAVPALSIAADKTTICQGDTVQFTAVPVNAGATPGYQWQVNGTPVGTDSDTLITSSLSNGDIISCILTSSVLCTLPVPSMNTIPMNVNEKPSVSFTRDTLVVRPGADLMLDPIVNGTIGSYVWTPATALNNPDVMDPIASPTATTTYQLLATTPDGCQASGKETIVLYYPLEMPSAFTPNGDGKNDVFRIPASTPQAINDFSVYDRWGERVFLTTNGSIGWDGGLNGKPQPPGVYVWMIQYRDPVTGKARMASGTVLLIR
jgi:gliding motility-associated-like protein